MCYIITLMIGNPVVLALSAAFLVRYPISVNKTSKVNRTDSVDRPASTTGVVAFTQHDHRRCKRSAMRSVVTLCEERKLRLTPVRQRTLEILLQAHTALGAYEILDKLSASGLGEKPPQVYRALGFLMQQGFVHKLEKMNA